MKHLIIIGAFAVAFTACDSKNDIEAARKATIDSMNNVAALEAKQRTIDSLERAKEQHLYTNSSNSSNSSQTTNEPTTAAEKKRMSNKTKGALIGAGAGVVAGAIGGAIINKEDPAKGAVIGGAIGGAVGSGVGYGAGAAKDKKATNTTTTNP